MSFHRYYMVVRIHVAGMAVAIAAAAVALVTEVVGLILRTVTGMSRSMFIAPFHILNLMLRLNCFEKLQYICFLWLKSIISVPRNIHQPMKITAISIYRRTTSIATVIWPNTTIRNIVLLFVKLVNMTKRHCIEIIQLVAITIPCRLASYILSCLSRVFINASALLRWTYPLASFDATKNNTSLLMPSQETTRNKSVESNLPQQNQHNVDFWSSSHHQHQPIVGESFHFSPSFQQLSHRRQHTISDFINSQLNNAHMDDVLSWKSVDSLTYSGDDTSAKNRIGLRPSERSPFSSKGVQRLKLNRRRLELTTALRDLKFDASGLFSAPGSSTATDDTVIHWSSLSAPSSHSSEAALAAPCDESGISFPESNSKLCDNSIYNFLSSVGCWPSPYFTADDLCDLELHVRSFQPRFKTIVFPSLHK